MTLKV